MTTKAEVVATYKTANSAYKGGGGREYKAALKRAMDDAISGSFLPDCVSFVMKR